MLKPIEGNPDYLIEATGRVWSVKANKFIKPAKKNSGYLFYKLFVSYDPIKNRRKYNYVHAHRVVAKAFLPNPQNLPCVNHIDGNKENNHVSNLEWVSHKENMIHAVKSGLLSKDIKLLDLTSIFEDFISGKYSLKELEDKYNWHSGSRITRSYLKKFAIENGKEEEYNKALKNLKSISGKTIKNLTKRSVLQFDKEGNLIREWDCISDAARALKLRQGCISNCCSGRSYSSGGYVWKYK